MHLLHVVLCLRADELSWHCPCCACCKILLLSVYWLTIKKQRPRKLHEYYYQKLRNTSDRSIVAVNVCDYGREPDQPHLIPWFMSSRLLSPSFLYSVQLASWRPIKEYLLFRSNNQTLNPTQKTYNSFEWTTDTRNKTIWSEFIDLFQAEFVIAGFVCWT